MIFNFNPHSHEGSDQWFYNRETSRYYFNPHSHEGSDIYTWLFTHIYKHFNPHSHEGSDSSHCSDIDRLCISIHTPTKGATIRYRKGIDKNIFQSTLPRRERQEAAELFDIKVEISIHTPTKGATVVVMSNKTIKNISIHTPTKGATNNYDNKCLLLAFQSTLPRRERQQY